MKQLYSCICLFDLKAELLFENINFLLKQYILCCVEMFNDWLNLFVIEEYSETNIYATLRRRWKEAFRINNRSIRRSKRFN